MRKALLLVLVITAAVVARRPAPPPLSLSVVTYNIRYANPDDGDDRWERRREEVARLIREHDPDVVGLQEALRSQLDDLARLLPEYAEIGVGRDDGKLAGEYAAILYRTARFTPIESGTFWFSDTAEVAGSRSWGNTCVRICTWARLGPALSDGPGRTFYIYNVHLDHESQNSRYRSADLLGRRLLQRSHREDPAIITGDFNAGETNAAIARIKSPPMTEYDKADGTRERPIRLVDTYRIVHPDGEAGTFNDFGHGHGSKDKIDYIFVARGTHVLDAGIDRRSSNSHFPSDHLAVWARVELGAGP